jgi:hypothetical protein
MEQLRAELSHLLGEKLSRMECVSERPDTTLWSCMTAREIDAATGEEFFHLALHVNWHGKSQCWHAVVRYVCLSCMA